jgi:hypothetical protein
MFTAKFIHLSQWGFIISRVILSKYMPFAIKKDPKSKKWVVITKGTGKVHGTHATKNEAVQQLKAMYANGAAED